MRTQGQCVRRARKMLAFYSTLLLAQQRRQQPHANTVEPAAPPRTWAPGEVALAAAGAQQGQWGKGMGVDEDDVFLKLSDGMRHQNLCISRVRYSATGN